MKKTAEKKKRINKLLVFWVVTALIAVFAVPLLVIPFTYYPVTLALKAKTSMENPKLPEYYDDVVSATDITRDVEYTDIYGGASLDLIKPKESGKYPLVIYFHGGYYVDDDKKNCEHYCRIIASNGYVVANVNYSLAPKYTYPAPLLQAEEALRFLLNNKDIYNFSNVFLAGDGAGAHLSAQYAALVTNEEYQDETGITPSLQKKDLDGTILIGGFFKPSAIRDSYVPFVATGLWAYTGEKKFEEYEKIKELDVIDHVSAFFPPTLMLCGKYDRLWSQSSKFRYILDSYNVQYYYETADESTPKKRYHLDFSDPAAQDSLDSVLAFLSERSA